MLYEFGADHNTVEATKNISCAKGEDAVDYNTVIRWLKKFHFSGCKNSMIGQGQVSLKLWISRTCSKS